jgi:hypothetical protein
MMSLTTKLYLVAPGALEETLSSGDPELMAQAHKNVERLSFPHDVKAQVTKAVDEMIEKGGGRPHLDIVRVLALHAIIGVIGELVDIDTLEAVPSLQGMLRSMGEVVDYNLDAHLFGNPPPPFKAADTAGTPLDIGYLDADEIEELDETLEVLEVSEEDLDEFSEEYGIELMEELVYPLTDALQQARTSGRDIMVITEG